MADHSGIEWTEAVWNPTTGCDRVSPGCDNCLAPDTPILMADLSWRPIGSVHPGDQVVAFTEEPSLGQNRVYEIATILAVRATERPAVEITVGGKEIVASEDHRFLAHARPYWRHAVDLRLQSRLVDIGIPSHIPNVDDLAYLAGYAAGAIRGDGTFRWEPGWRSDKKGYPQSYCRVAVLAEDHPILDRLVAAYDAHGIGHPSIRSFDTGRKGRPLIALEVRALHSLEAIATSLLPERDDLAWKSGWLAGFFDTDGSYSGKNLRWSQSKDPLVLEQVAAYAADLGFSVKVEVHPGGGCPTAILLGSLEDRIRLLSTIRPALDRKLRDFVGRRFPAKTATPVDGVRRVGTRSLIDIETTSGTFIAAGIATHNCYALTLAKRLKAMGSDKYQVDGDPRTSGPGFKLTLHPGTLDLPRSWRQPRTVFVDSMSDLFHPEVPFDYIQRVFDVMADTPQHTYQILTKRSKRLTEVASSLEWPANVWMGVSVENETYGFRIDHLRQVPAAIRFLSLEPLLGPLPGLELSEIHWVIAGGESGPGARPVEESWLIDIRDQCERAKVAFFFKQWGGRTPKAGGRQLQGKVYDGLPVMDVIG